MSGKLDQSLDQILGDRKKNGPRRGRVARRAVGSARVTKGTPAGGVQKNTKTQKNAVPAITNGKPASTETKIIVSNLPSDVSEQQIKEYFGDAVSPVARAMLTYGPNGVSRGIATVIFKKPGAANDAVKKLNGVQVDKRPMRIEVVLDAASATQRATKALSERTTQPKSAAPKPAADKKEATRGGKAGRGRPRGRGGRAGRAKPKTAEELDAEMADYFDPNAPVANTENAPVTNGATTNGDDAMDEIS